MAVVPASWDAILAESLALKSSDFRRRACQGVDTFAATYVAVAVVHCMPSWENDSTTLPCSDGYVGNIVMPGQPYSLDDCWGTAAASSGAAGALGIAFAVDVGVVAAVAVEIVMARMSVVALCSLWIVDAKQVVVLVNLTGPANYD